MKIPTTSSSTLLAIRNSTTTSTTTTTIIPTTTLVPRLQTLSQRQYATQTSLGTTPQGPKRKKTVTAFNDDGQVPWSELSAGEKAGRATQQSFNFGMIIVGFVLTGGVGYYLWTDVFSPDSKTVQFNIAVDRVKSDPKCLDVLGDAKKISAHGEETSNKWRRSRPIASTTNTDSKGTDHFLMNFYVEGPRNRGTVHIHMVRPKGQSNFDYKYLWLDVRGHQRIYLENADADPKNPHKSKMKFLGISWG